MPAIELAHAMRSAAAPDDIRTPNQAAALSQQPAIAASVPGPLITEQTLWPRRLEGRLATWGPGLTSALPQTPPREHKDARRHVRS
jgi:hypothetical protein